MRKATKKHIGMLLIAGTLLVPGAYGAERVTSVRQLRSAAKAIPAARPVNFQKPTKSNAAQDRIVTYKNENTKKTQLHATTLPSRSTSTRSPSTDTKTTTDYKTRLDYSELVRNAASHARSTVADYQKRDVTRAAKADPDTKGWQTGARQGAHTTTVVPKDDQGDRLPEDDQQQTTGSQRSESAPKSTPVSKSTQGITAYAPVSRQAFTRASEKASVTLKNQDKLRLAAVDKAAPEIALPGTDKQPDIDKPVPNPQQPQARLYRKISSQSLPKADIPSEIAEDQDVYPMYVLTVEVVKLSGSEEVKKPEAGVSAQENRNSSEEQVGKKDAQKGISVSDVLTRDKDNSRLVRRTQTVSASELAFGNLRLLPPLDVFIPQNTPEKAENTSGRPISQTNQNGQGSFNAVIDTDKTFKDQQAARAMDTAGRVLNDQWKLPASCGPPRTACPQSFDTVPAVSSAKYTETRKGAAEKPRTFQNPQKNQDQNSRSNQIEPPPLSLSLPWLVSKANVAAVALF